MKEVYCMKKESKIAGVTFNNDVCDGGESRRALLKQLQGKPSIVRLVHCKFHNEQTGLDEKAIKVKSKLSGKVLGYIPRCDIDRLWGVSQMVLFVNCYNGQYSGALMPSVPPTAKQFGSLKAKQRKGAIERLPEYDKLCYAYAIETLK